MDSDLTEERGYLTASRETLARMIEHARYRVATGDTIAGDGYSAEVLGRELRTRAKVLAEESNAPLYFGRLAFGPDAEHHADLRYHIGRRRIADESGEPLVVDWRAPVARHFYQATAADPQGVTIRRRFGWTLGRAHPAELTGFEDEHLDAGQELGVASRLVTEEIERPRVGPMRDIVATIQPDQDELVRADLDESICVQGGPGTGKTNTEI